jgi:peroxiredoxin family protein
MAENEKMAIVVYHGSLDEALAAFILASTGASMGMEVSMFFTFWGLDIIKKNEGKIKSPGWMRNMMNNVMNRGGSKRLKLSKFHMMGMGTNMIKQLMKESNYPTVDEFITMVHDMGVKMYPCSTSCGIFGVPQEAFRPEIEEITGAAYFLNEARKAKVTLFI